MWIARIDLENIKSYRQASVTFTEGINAICGPNGAGKSTLLEAIGFALFDCAPYSQSQFIREGEKTAVVTVHLVGEDERTYQVVRRCGSGSQHYVYDPEIGRLTTSKEETIAWLGHFLGVEEMGNMAALFHGAIGVPQGLMTAAFLETPANRKSIFNPLLRVDEYKRVWDALLEPRRLLEGQIASQDRHIAGLEAEVGKLPGWMDKVAGLRTAIEAGEKQRAALEARLEDVARRKADLEAVKERLDALKQQVAQAEGTVQTVQARLTSARAAVARAEEARSIVRKAEAGHQAYLLAQAHLAELEPRRQARDRLNETLRGYITDLALARQQREALESRLQAVAAAETEMARLQPQVEAQERLEENLAEARHRAARLAEVERNRRQEQARLTGLEARLADVQADLVVLADVERDIASLQAELGALDRQRNDLAAQIAAHQAALDQLREQAASAAQRLTAAQQGLSHERGRLADLEARLAEVRVGLDELAGVERKMETLRAELAALDEQLAALTTQVAAYQAERSQVQAQTTVLEAAEVAECPVCRGPLTPAHRAELLSGHRARLTELEAALAETQSQQNEAAKTRDRKQRALGGLERQARELPRPADADALAAQIDDQRQVVARHEAALAAEQTDLAAHQTRQAEVETALAELRPRLDEIEGTRGQKQQALERLEKRRQELPRPAEADELAAQIEAQRQTLQEIKAAVTELADAPAEVERLNAELAALGDPRRDHQRAADTASQRPAVEQDLAATRSLMAELERRRDAVQEQLADYAGLDERTQAERTTLNAHEVDHQRYMQHIREAETLEEWQTRAASLDEELQAARAEHGRLSQERDRVAASYDAAAYADLVAEHSALSSERAALRERLRLQRSQVDEGQAEIDRLTGVQRTLETARAEHRELVEVRAILDHLRAVLRDAGPKVTQALVEVISLQAAHLYADIMADHTARLRWTEDYEIVLTTGGRERTFKQLSGGEQMAAALAVRLALLREVSGIDMAFFDEPTANLDDHRRDNLAEQILNVKGFSQLFVISHDDTFERNTDHVVRVVKENGVSRVEA